MYATHATLGEFCEMSKSETETRKSHLFSGICPHSSNTESGLHLYMCLGGEENKVNPTPH
jgi:hypothetical protein